MKIELTFNDARVEAELYSHPVAIELGELLPLDLVFNGLPVSVATPRLLAYATSSLITPRRIGFRASPLSLSRRCGLPRAATPMRKTFTASGPLSVFATKEATFRRDWSSSSWKITHLRPPSHTYSVAASCQQALGNG